MEDITFEDLPIAQARAMGRGPRMDPVLYQALRQKIASLSQQAARMPLPPDVRVGTMKQRMLRIAGELQVPVTVRRVAGGVVFWRSTAEDLQQDQAVAARLQGAQRRRRRGRPGRRQ